MINISKIKLTVILVSSISLNCYLLKKIGYITSEINNLRSNITSYHIAEDIPEKINIKFYEVEKEFHKNNLFLLNYSNNKKNIDVNNLCNLHNNVNCLYFNNGIENIKGNSDNEKNINLNFY